jgi:hypothetical protein
LGELVNVVRAESVPYSNHDWVGMPFGIAVPFRLALVGVIEVAARVVTIGVEPELLVPPPPPSPPQVANNSPRRRRGTGKNFLNSLENNLGFIAESRR